MGSDAELDNRRQQRTATPITTRTPVTMSTMYLQSQAGEKSVTSAISVTWVPDPRRTARPTVRTEMRAQTKVAPEDK